MFGYASANAQQAKAFNALARRLALSRFRSRFTRRKSAHAAGAYEDGDGDEEDAVANLHTRVQAPSAFGGSADGGEHGKQHEGRGDRRESGTCTFRRSKLNKGAAPPALSNPIQHLVDPDGTLRVREAAQVMAQQLLQLRDRLLQDDRTKIDTSVYRLLTQWLQLQPQGHLTALTIAKLGELLQWADAALADHRRDSQQRTQQSLHTATAGTHATANARAAEGSDTDQSTPGVLDRAQRFNILVPLLILKLFRPVTAPQRADAIRRLQLRIAAAHFLHA
ncbi:hypothetical protein [Mycetohabitans sp. B46]|uniref:hypothetical protein n=1 Tax=Mycetohabitans sp. B46 TaxID=2772536 RepID=UPI00307F8E1F